MSPEGTGAAREAATTAEPPDRSTANDNAVEISHADDADPWFSPGPKLSPGRDATAAAPSGAPTADSAPTGYGDGQADWFLPTGRAGLRPDAMTVDWGDDETVTFELRVESAGAPPWAGEKADLLATEPPPWETGPWPGPGGLDGLGGASRRASAAAGSSARPGGYGGSLHLPGGAGGRWTARTVVAAGLVPLVVPGLLVGVRSLRQQADAAMRKAAWVAIGASLAWAVIIVIAIVIATAGGGAATCGGYPTAVRQAYQKALTDLSDRAPQAVQAADLETAANRADVSAAAVGQLGVRTALFAMATDMAQARADVLARRQVPAALRQHLVQDGTAPTGSCAG